MQTPMWINKDGYDCDEDHVEYSFFGLVPKVIFKVTFEDPKSPVILVDRDGTYWTWSDNLLSDKNSVPACCRAIFPSDYGEPSCFLHDHAYKYGWLWCRIVKLNHRGRADTRWAKRRITRKIADDLIYQGWYVAGVTKWRAVMARWFLRVLGWGTWHEAPADIPSWSDG